MTESPSGELERIFLIGLRGSGKTTLARLLAEQLGWSWCDADDALEQKENRSIRAIFADEGEEGFRRKEASLLLELSRRHHCVIATGGGIVLRPENRDLLRSGWVVWLTADVSTLCQRLRADRTTDARRPALTTAPSASSPEEVAALLASREPLYRECARLTVTTTGRSPLEIVEEILAAMRERGG